MSSDPRLLRLHAADNVLTVAAAIAAGENLSVEGETLRAAQRLPLGYKVAARAIGAGERILKYGVPIGSATAAIAPGELVHTHNLRSDYLPTWLREDQARLFATQHSP